VRWCLQVADIDLKSVGPVGNGKVICLSVYGGPDVDFGTGKGKVRGGGDDDGDDHDEEEEEEEEGVGVVTGSECVPGGGGVVVVVVVRMGSLGFGLCF
jgi:hypothetical protein